MYVLLYMLNHDISVTSVCYYSIDLSSFLRICQFIWGYTLHTFSKYVSDITQLSTVADKVKNTL